MCLHLEPHTSSLCQFEQFHGIVVVVVVVVAAVVVLYYLQINISIIYKKNKEETYMGLRCICVLSPILHPPPHRGPTACWAKNPPAHRDIEP
jgi:hypothetical protein